MAQPPDEDDGTTNISVPSLAAVIGPKHKAGYLMVVSSGAQLTGRMFKLTQAEMVIGRSPTADIRVADEGVSRAHARFVTLADGRFRLIDLGSRNGTYVNGQRITEIDLKDGDRLAVGSTAVLLFSLQDELEEQFTQRLYESATHDGLTGLLNKTYFKDALSKELSFALRYKSAFSMLMIDIDHFKQLNDTHGHPAGDLALSRLGERLAQLTRNEDVVARYGGEEFCALLRRADVSSARICAERYRAAAEALEIRIGNTSIKTSISVGGVSVDGGVPAQADAVIAQADAKLYEAKRAGRNRVIVQTYVA